MILKNGKISISYILFLFLILGLYGTITNKIYISPIPTGIALISLPLTFVLKKRIHFVTLFLLPYTLVTIASIYFYYPQSFKSFLFFRYDGNFFVSFLPLLVFPFFKYSFNLDKVVRRFLIFSILLYLLTYFFGLTFEGKNFHGFFKAHNAAGGFFSFLSTIAIIVFYKKKTVLNFLLLAAATFLLLKTGSRGSLLGFILGATCYFLYLWKGKGFIFFVFLSLMTVTIWVVSTTYDTYRKHNFSSQEDVAQYIRKSNGRVGSKKMNVYQRGYGYWPRATYAFLSSPLIGIGYGGVNDLPIILEENYFVAFNQQPNKVFDNQHGHNSYLHILAEQGLMGLFLFLLFWIYLYKYLEGGNRKDTTRAILLMSFFSISIMAFTEHRITTPSNCLPFVILLSLYIMKQNSLKSQRAYA